MVTTLSSGPSPRYLAVLMAPTMLQMQLGPNLPKRWQARLRHTQAVDQHLRAALHHLHAAHGVFVVDQHQQVGVEDVVDQRHHLVADALDAVLALAAIVECAALARLQRHDPGCRAKSDLT